MSLACLGFHVVSAVTEPNVRTARSVSFLHFTSARGHERCDEYLRDNPKPDVTTTKVASAPRNESVYDCRRVLAAISNGPTRHQINANPSHLETPMASTTVRLASKPRPLAEPNRRKSAERIRTEALGITRVIAIRNGEETIVC